MAARLVPFGGRVEAMADDLDLSEMSGVPRLSATESLPVVLLRVLSSDELLCERELTADLHRSLRAIDGGREDDFNSSTDLMRF